MKEFYLYALLICSIFAKSQQWVWAKDMGPGRGTEIKADVFGNLYMLASTGNSYGGITHTCGTSGSFAKHDPTGNCIWRRGLNGVGVKLNLDKVGNVYITGHFTGTMVVCGGNNSDIIVSCQSISDIFLLKYDNNGNLLFVKTWDNTADDRTTASVTDLLGNTYLAGVSSWQSHPHATADLDHFLIKYDAVGNLLWTKTSNWKGSMLTKGLDLDPEGNLYIAGHFKDTACFDNTILTDSGPSRIYIAKYNGNGLLQWAKKDGTAYDECNDLKVDKKGGLYVTGKTSGQSVFSGTALNPDHMFLARYDTTGNFLWAKTCPVNFGSALCVDTAGAAYVTGNFTGTIAINSTNGPTTLSTQKQAALYVVKFLTSGSADWAITTGGSGFQDNGLSLCHNNQNSCFVTGYYTGTTSFGSITFSGNQVYNSKIFISKIDGPNGTITSISSTSIASDFQVTPNPCSHSAVIKFTDRDVQQVKISALNLTGQVIWASYYESPTGDFSKEINTSEFPDGIYFLVTDIYYTGKPPAELVSKLIIQKN
jgi:hypothetical protein